MWLFVTSLIVIGLLLIVLEILVIPGGIAGIIGFISMAVGVYLAYSEIGNTEGTIVLVSTLAINIIALILILRSKTWNKLMLKKNIDAKVNLIDEKIVRIGAVGTTVSRCAPTGKASIEGQFYEVFSPLGFIDEGIEIVVTKVEKNKIYVNLKN